MELAVERGSRLVHIYTWKDENSVSTQVQGKAMRSKQMNGKINASFYWSSNGGDHYARSQRFGPGARTLHSIAIALADVHSSLRVQSQPHRVVC